MVQTKTMPLGREELLEPVLVLAGIERSLASGRAAKIAHI
jgi:hypothetical protein